jgi:toxin ParE1/3/4
VSIQYDLTAEAIQDLDDVWLFIARDDPKAADRVESAILEACQRLSEFPMLGKSREDVTHAPVRFWTVPRFCNYCVVYLPETRPLQILGILQARRDFSAALSGRL